jgi:hypothetical protein
MYTAALFTLVFTIAGIIGAVVYKKILILVVMSLSGFVSGLVSGSLVELFLANIYTTIPFWVLILWAGIQLMGVVLFCFSDMQFMTL